MWNTPVNHLWTMDIHLNSEGQECKTDPIKE
jgi:hypothetical protein